MRLFRSPIILPLLVLVVFTATCVLAVPAGDNGSSSSSSSSSTKGRLAKLLGRFKKNKPPSLLDHLNAYMPAHEYAELKPTWDRAVEQGWIRPDTGTLYRKRSNAFARKAERLMTDEYFGGLFATIRYR